MENQTGKNFQLLSKNSIIQTISRLSFALPTSFFTPIAALIGIVLNVAILYYMPQCNGIPSKIRVFYIAIAVFDLLNVIALHVLFLFPTGLAVLTEGTINIPLFESISDLTCSISRNFIRISEGCGASLTFAFSIERAFVIRNPFLARKINFKLNFWIIFGIIIFNFICGIVPFNSFYLKAFDSKGYSVDCAPRTQQIHLILNAIVDFIAYIIPNFGLLFSTICIMRMLKERNEHLKNMAPSSKISKGSSQLSNTEMETVKILVLLAIFQCSLYIPFATLSAFNKLILAENELLRAIKIVFVIPSIIRHSVVFIFYFRKIKEFRRKINFGNF